MFFNRKARNRRFHRAHILDVKLRSSVRRQTRLRRGALALAAICGVLIGLAVCWQGGEYLLRRFVYSNPAFAIHQLDVETDGIISLEQIRSWAGVRLRDNLLALDIVRVKRDLEMVPSIEAAAVERVMPHTLRIRITEREPVAVAMLPGADTNLLLRAPDYTIDATGFFMFPLAPQSLAAPPATNDSLPMLTGIPAADLRPGRTTDSAQVRAALRLLRAFQQSPMNGVVNLRRVDLGLPGVLVVTTGQSNEVHFGLGDPEPQFRRWRSVHDHAQRTGRHLAWIDLSVSNNVPARWAEATFVPPPVPRPPRPSPYRKKHV